MSSSTSPPPFRGPCADDPLGEALIDALADVALAGFAAELSACRFLCNETFQVRDPGAVADVLRRAVEQQCGASAVRAARREAAELAELPVHTLDRARRVEGTTQLVRAAARGDEPRVRVLVALGGLRAPPRRSADGDHRAEVWNPLNWAIFNGHEGVARTLLDIGMDVKAARFGNISALSVARAMRHEGVLRLLEQRGTTTVSRLTVNVYNGRFFLHLDIDILNTSHDDFLAKLWAALPEAIHEAFEQSELNEYWRFLVAGEQIEAALADSVLSKPFKFAQYGSHVYMIRRGWRGG